MTPSASGRVMSGTTAMLTVLLWTVPWLSAPARAEGVDGTPTIEQLQATLLITIARYVEWPSTAFTSATAPMVVGIVSDDAVAEAFAAAAAGRNVQGRTMVMKRLQWESDMTGVRLLLIGQVERRRVVALLAQIHREPILTVSMMPQFASVGGMIALTDSGGRLSFSVNARATGDSGLRLSALLLSHATGVSHEPGPGTP